ncbi:MAG: PEP-CTERM sorting domain-containing protein [Kiritimatiellae bacterium]|nr:PEP-CTERM sorting domain-containing protein [Kiritimatiellia bacterium]MDD4737266.1 PEP-CTERM sorting domain-containing protein [Kiritimatiellia bacterium]
MRKIHGCCMVAGLFLAASAGADLLQNPGFETEGASSWNAADWNNESDIGRMDWAQHSGSYGMAGYGDADGKWGYIAQTVSSAYNAASNIYTFSIWGMAEENFSSSGNEVYMKFSFKHDDTELGYFTDNIYSAFTADTEWHQYSMTVTNTSWLAANAVEVCFGYGQAVSNAAGNCGLRVDDASLIQVPEPASLSMILLGLAGLFVFCRRFRQEK